MQHRTAPAMGKGIPMPGIPIIMLCIISTLIPAGMPMPEGQAQSAAQPATCQR